MSVGICATIYIQRDEDVSEGMLGVVVLPEHKREVLIRPCDALRLYKMQCNDDNVMKQGVNVCSFYI